MKRSLLAAIVGTGAVAASFGQGHILISNYLTPPYNQVVWSGNSSTPGQAINDSSLTFQIFYGAGVVTDASSLTAGVTFHLSQNPAVMAFDPGAGHGPGGYFLNVVQVLPEWVPGDTYTFIYGCVTLGYEVRSALWYESAQIQPIANPPLASAEVPGLTLTPEPTVVSIVGFGVVTAMLCRARHA